MATYPIPKKIKAFGEVFRQAGWKLYIVGGCIRDWLLGQSGHDYDFATDATPQEVTSLFRGHVIPTGIEHGTVTVRYYGDGYEVTTFRTESDYADMRHPGHVEFVRSLEEDLKRRDFTINAFAVDVSDGSIIDLHHGMDDLKNHLIRAIGDPKERLEEDALRILRALRFASKLDFSIEPETLGAMRDLAGNLSHVSAERIHDEVTKLVMTDHPAKGLLLMDESRVLDVIMPELAKGRDVQQNGMHDDTVLHHNIMACQAAANHHYGLYVRLAALLHDVGKSDTVVYHPVANTYYGHDKKGAELAWNILTRLKASNEERERVCHLIAEHMFAYTPAWTDSAVRRFITRVGKDSIDDLFRLRFCDEEAMSGKASWDSVAELDSRIKKILAEGDALSLKDLAVNGNDLMQAGIPKGPALGKTLSYLLDCVIEDPAQNTKERLLLLARKHQERTGT